MQALLIGASIFFVLFAIIMTVVASKLLRANRARSAARIAALQAVAAEPAETLSTAGAGLSLALAATPAGEPPLRDETWDLALRAPRIAEAPVAASPEVRTSKFDLRQAQVAPSLSRGELRSSFFEEPIQRTPTRRWTWVAAAGLLMVSIPGVVYLISSGVIGRAVATNQAKLAATSVSPIELLSLRHSIDTSGNFIVTGLVQNPAASAALRGVFAVVYLFDAEGRYFANSRAALESAVLSPGGEAAFVVRVPASSPSLPSLSSLPSVVSRYRVSFQHEDGAAVNHIDRRGALPTGTTGDAVQTPAPGAPLVTARKD